MFDISSTAAGAAETSLPGFRQRARPASGPASPAPSAIRPHAVSRWACGEGVRAGDPVALLVRDLGQAEALRLGLARIGARAICLDPSTRGAALAGAVATSGAALAVVDTALAGAYGTVMGRLASYPLVWWNGPGADFANLDCALAELA